MPLQTVVSVPCQAQSVPGASSQAAICTTLVLYARPVIQQSQPLHDFLRVLSATTERATALAPAGVNRLAKPSYAQHPLTASQCNLSHLLLVAARALEARALA